jgi:hypothetical protein
LAWRRIARATDERTFIASVLPSLAIPNTARVILVGEQHLNLTPCLLACLDSFAFDYVARQKIGGTDVSDFIAQQLPLLPPSTYALPTVWHKELTLKDWIGPRVIELTVTSWDLEPFARDIGYDGPPFRWDPARRFQLRCELDAAFFHLYGLSHDDADYVMDTFPIVHKNDEKAHGEYRTKRVVLEIYDRIAEAAHTGKTYQTRLDPPPADRGVAHEPRVPEVPAMPVIAPLLPQDQEAALLIWALLRAHGGSIPRSDLARGFALRARPELLVRLAPAALGATVQEWASKVGQRATSPGLLMAALRTLSDRDGVSLATDSASRSIVTVTASTPLDNQIDPWFRFEARLALNVLRAQRRRVPDVIDAAITGADRALLG